MKKLNLVTLAAAGILAIGGLASVTACGADKPGNGGGKPDNDAGTIEGNGGGELIVGSPSLQIPFVKSMAQKYNDKLAAANKKTFTFKFRINEENSIDSIPDWKEGPDVYAYPSDKINSLSEAGALIKLGGTYEQTVRDNLTQDAIKFATHGTAIKGYPFAADNGYYLFYNKKLIKDVSHLSSVEALLEDCKSSGNKFAYNLTEAFYTIGALGTFGAKYKVTQNAKGEITKIDANYNNQDGIDALTAMKKIMSHEAWQDTITAPTAANKVAACVDGSWNIAAYKKALGDDLGAVKMPTVTVGERTKTLGSFIGYKLYGVNPQKGDNQRIIRAHEFASYLVSDEVQLARFNDSNIDPTSKTLREQPEIKNNTFIKAIRDQVATKAAIPQTAVPGTIWDAAKVVANVVKQAEGELDETTATKALSNFEKSIVNL